MNIKKQINKLICIIERKHIPSSELHKLEKPNYRAYYEDKTEWDDTAKAFVKGEIVYAYTFCERCGEKIMVGGRVFY
ncbi:hypothetical protein A3K64_04070 [Candidatus Micrarchaeota archaeon RBG_16_36_9]|nr:MAG: hypothetical protein A3K64_04070 [Candidatus Micrarchaeota archaeon RBG_16_36_9]